MQQLFDQVLQFLQQGVSAIFRFVRAAWAWSSGEITKLFQVTWENWPLWKQLLLLLLAAVLVWILLGAAVQLWAAAIRVLSAFAGLLVTLVATLPAILIAGLVALGGLWAINNINLASVPIPSVLSGGDGGNRQATRSAAEEPDNTDARRTSPAESK